MKSRAFVFPFLPALAVLSCGREALADSKQECAAAADTGQSARDQGRYRAAHEAFAACARDTCPRIVAQMCGTWLRDLDGATPTLVLGAHDANGTDLTEVHVTLDGSPFTERLDGKPLPIDPGAHTVRFARDGYEPVEERVVARSGEKNRLVVVTLKATTAPASTATTDTPAPAPETSSSSGGRIATGVVLFALAGASAGAGALFLVKSNQSATDAANLRAGIPSYACTTGTSAICTALGQDVDAQHHEALASGLFFGGAGALAIAGLTTLLLWPHHDDRGSASITPSVGMGRASLDVTGSF